MPVVQAGVCPVTAGDTAEFANVIGMSSKPKSASPAVNHRRRRYLVLGLGVIVLAAVGYFGPALREQEPDYYDPARAALVNARLRLEESIGHEKALLVQLQRTREELDAAIAQLEKAADLDPADRARIERLRSRLLSIESPDSTGAMNSKNLHASYQELLGQMESLIKEMDSRTR